MMFNELNASGYRFNGIFYNAEFEDILSKIISCYHLMLSDNVVLKNNENEIRDELYLNYLNSDPVRKSIGLQYYYFDRETQEDRTVGRTDIRVLTTNSFLETAAYYIIECKRLDSSNTNGTTGLNAQYIENGICRFVSHRYSSYYKTNGMIGFIVHSVDISKNVASINKLIKKTYTQANTQQELSYREIAQGFDFSYCSTHTVGSSNIILYHLMFDFSNNVTQY